MGKTEGGSTSSWLTAVKRVFRSPVKDNNGDSSETRSSRTPHIQQEPQPQQHKKKEKKGWLFRKPTNHEAAHQTITQNRGNNSNNVVSEAEKRHAIAVAVATAKAAEAAVATAQAAVEIAHIAGTTPSNYPRENYAATIIQTAFRGYLARRALRALKGVVKLQALVRGHNVRTQAKMTLQCMQALVRVQSRVLDQRVRLSNDGGSRKSTFSDTNSFWEPHSVQDACDKKSMSRDGSSIADEWDERAHTVEEVKAMLQHRKESALKRERNLSQAFSQQMRRSNRNKSFGSEEEIRPLWQDKWMHKGRASTDRNDSYIKTVEMDNTSQAQRPQTPYSYLPPTNYRRPNQHQRSTSHCPSSPLHQNLPHHQSPATPSPSRLRPMQVRSASPCYNRPQTPSLKSNYSYNSVMSQQKTTVPSYMAATESARARARSYSAPRQRPSNPDRERATSAAKKRLSYNNGHDHMRSPSFKSMSGVMHMGVEQQSIYSSCYTDSLGGEISPSSTTDLRRWLSVVPGSIVEHSPMIYQTKTERNMYGFVGLEGLR